MIFDATLYANKPATVMQSFTYINGNEASKRNFYGVSNHPTCLDLEGLDNTQIQAVLNDFKAQHPGVKVGVYGTLPRGSYWQAVCDKKDQKWQAWNTLNDGLMQLSRSVDIVYPSLYTFYDDRVGWMKSAIRNIKQAYKFNKTVYPFLWPQYHVSSVKNLQYMPADYFKLQVETCLDLADGVVIWGGWDFAKPGPAQWNDNSDWYNVIKRLT